MTYNGPSQVITTVLTEHGTTECLAYKSDIIHLVLGWQYLHLLESLPLAITISDNSCRSLAAIAG
jgi:hypothetical protein